MERRRTRRWLLWPGLLTPTGIFCFAALAFLLPPDALVWPDGITGHTYRADAAIGTATLTRHPAPAPPLPPHHQQ